MDKPTVEDHGGLWTSHLLDWASETGFMPEYSMVYVKLPNGDLARVVRATRDLQGDLLLEVKD